MALFRTLQDYEASLVLSLEVDLVAAPKSSGIYQFYRSLKIKNASVRYFFFFIDFYLVPAMYFRILRRI